MECGCGTPELVSREKNRKEYNATVLSPLPCSSLIPKGGSLIPFTATGGSEGSGQQKSHNGQSGWFLPISP